MKQFLSRHNMFSVTSNNNSIKACTISHFQIKTKHPFIIYILLNATNLFLSCHCCSKNRLSSSLSYFFYCFLFALISGFFCKKKYRTLILTQLLIVSEIYLLIILKLNYFSWPTHLKWGENWLQPKHIGNCFYCKSF